MGQNSEHFTNVIRKWIPLYVSTRHLFDVDFVPVIESFDQDVRVPRNGDDIDLPHRQACTVDCFNYRVAHLLRERNMLTPNLKLRLAVSCSPDPGH